MRKGNSGGDKAAPYPLSYDPRIVNLDVLDHLYLTQLRKSVTWVDFGDKPPAWSLDLGCGTGAWILDAAKEWKDCRFVGFDLVHIQPRRQLLPRRLSERIQWVHGNFLTGRLPFEDNSFDHVHLHRVGWGIAETQWDGLFEEIARVLRPGGAVEVAEEDILFPTLPRSYTLSTRQPRPSAPYPRLSPSLTLSPPPSPLEDEDAAPHAHMLLESLFFGVFERRMINLRPTAIIPHHFNIHFRNVISTPSIEYAFPPPPLSRQQLRHVPSDTTARPRRRRFDGSESESEAEYESESSISSDEEYMEGLRQQQQTPPHTNSSLSSLSSVPSPSRPPRPPRPANPSITTAPATSPSPSASSPPRLLGVFKGTLPAHTKLLPPVPMPTPDRSLQLTAVFQRILACKEAMWEELRRRLHQRCAGGPDLLQGLGWDEDDGSVGGDMNSGSSEDGSGSTVWEGESAARARFEERLAQFERDMRYRTGLGDAVEGVLGWKRPARAPISGYERLREAELERAIGEAMKRESLKDGGEGEVQVSRSCKGFVGFKEGRK
ncbi:hypothetical protein K439DRAFT_1642896 [Ramaria rubella]|nr:hypothetical protein K439DRAFT_1642896 [Ramaria rubella]